MNSTIIPGCPEDMSVDTLTRWRDGLLAASQAQSVERHISTCRACRAYLEQYQQDVQRLRRFETTVTQQDVWNRVQPRMRRTVPAQRMRAIIAGTSAFLAAAIMVALFATVLHNSGKKNVASTPPPVVTTLHLYALVQRAGSFPSGPTYSLNGYDSTNGHNAFTHPLPSATFTLVTGNHMLGVPSIQGANPFLLLFDANGHQTKQISVGTSYPDVVLSNGTAFFVGGNTDIAHMNSGAPAFAAYDATTSARIWQHNLPNARTIDNFLLVGHDLIGNVEMPDGPVLTAFDSTTGAQAWQATPGAFTDLGSGSIGASVDTVFIVQYNPSTKTTLKSGEYLSAYDAATGTMRWRKTFAPQGTTAGVQLQILAADQNAVYCTVINSTTSTNSTAQLAAFATNDGHAVWSVPETDVINAPTNGFVPIANGTLFVTSSAASENSPSASSSLLAVNVQTGAILWQSPLTATPVTAPLFFNTGIALGMQTNSTGGGIPNQVSIMAFRTTDGSTLWKTPMTSGLFMQLVTLP